VKPKVYLETTVISYLAARPSRDIVVAAHQELTRQWWDQRRKDYHLVVSEVVLREAADGDHEAAERRSSLLAGIDVLEVGQSALELAEELVDRRAVPAVAAEDALHIAIAVTNGVNYLLTWNCTHIANAAMRRAIDDVCVAQGYEPTVLCTPEELSEE
jgi:predicted nucleic acid-binding protein